MSTFVIFIVVMIGLLVALFYFLIWFSTSLVKLFVETRHRDTEVILATRKAPPRWRKHPFTHLGSYVAKRYALYRVRSLARYFEATPMVDGPETREVIVGDLKRLEKEWREKPWREIRF